ncbi:DUF4407 domain-containing protein [Skermania sp. ID1734]|uniref:DUF4407 domain-containing protein n=1 Tax=Skermania sp. ID1734 TaxID=2597516 RepID=UPI00117FDDE0|nr:DUF4407 domain-containing protein [Skermania sp. ID1734]TSD99187.1 DUF4407 domain-containing protein [Skermania sp. ID1734]
MGVHSKSSGPQTVRSTIGDTLVWLGGGHADEENTRHEHAAYQVGGVVVLLGGLLAWLVATLAIASATSWSVWAILPCTLLVGLVAATVSRAIASGSQIRWYDYVARGVVALFLGAVLGELASIALFSGSINQALNDQAAHQVADNPAVTRASSALDQLRADRARLDNDVRDARQHRDDALVVARCEFNPNPACPPQKITGVPGAGPETKTANELLASAQQEFDVAAATRDREAPGLDKEIQDAETTLAQAQAAAPAQVDRGLAARWTAMHNYTIHNAGALIFRLLTTAFFALLSLLPLLLKLWRGETGLDRRTAAELARTRAELDADTAIAIKRAEVRVEAETLWADQKLASARYAIEAQTTIDRENERQRAIGAAPGIRHRTSDPLRLDRSEPAVGFDEPVVEAEVEDPPIARDVAAATGLNDSAPSQPESRNLPVPAKSAEVAPRRGGPLGVLPAAMQVSNPLPDLTKAVGGFVRPFVPPVISKTFERGNNTVRTARSVIEEFDEVRFSFTRRRKVVEEHKVDEPARPQEPLAPADPAELGRSWIDSTRVETPQYHHQINRSWSSDPIDAPFEDLTPGLIGRVGEPELTEAKGPRQLPPGN